MPSTEKGERGWIQLPPEPCAPSWYCSLPCSGLADHREGETACLEGLSLWWDSLPGGLQRGLSLRWLEPSQVNVCPPASELPQIPPSRNSGFPHLRGHPWHLQPHVGKGLRERRRVDKQSLESKGSASYGLAGPSQVSPAGGASWQRDPRVMTLQEESPQLSNLRPRQLARFPVAQFSS